MVVVGSSGSGKTTVARALAERLAVHYVELDALHHKPNWTEASADELREAVHRELDGRERWVVDGNYYGKLGDFVLAQADTVIWLDLPLRTCLSRLWTRTTRRIRTNEELWNGNHETWRGAFWGRESLFWWTVRHHSSRRRRWPRRCCPPEPNGRPIANTSRGGGVPRYPGRQPTPNRFPATVTSRAGDVPSAFMTQIDERCGGRLGSNLSRSPWCRRRAAAPSVTTLANQSNQSGAAPCRA